MTRARQVAAKLRDGALDGFVLAARALREFISVRDRKGRPVESWNANDVEELPGSIRGVIRGIREEYEGEEGVTAWIKNHQGTVEEARECLKLMRKNLRKQEPQVAALITKIAKSLKDPATAEAARLYLRGWHDLVQKQKLDMKAAARELVSHMSGEALHLRTPSDGVTQQMLSAIARGDYTVKPDMNIPLPSAGGVANFKDKEGVGTETWEHKLMPGAMADALENLLPAPELNEKVVAAINKYAASLGDLDSDLMHLAMIKYAQYARKPGDEVRITIDEIMEVLGHKKHAGGADGVAYRAEDKRMIRERLEALQDGYLTVYKAYSTGGRKGKRLDVESRILTIQNKIGQADILTGRVRDWVSVDIVFGRAWSSRLFSDTGRLTALMQARALEYHPERERIEKRILKSLGWFWRMNWTKTATAQRTVLDWLRKDVGDERFMPGGDDSKFQRRDAERLEEAFDRLLKDKQIGGWHYADERPPITGCGPMARGWLERWLEREIVVKAPADLLRAYEADGRMGKQLPKPKKPAALALPSASEPFGPGFKKFRISLNMTGLQVAEITKINNTTLSRIESGKREPTPEQRRIMEEWMQQMAQAAGQD